MGSRSVPSLIVLALLAAPARAQAMQFGAQVSLAQPQQDLAGRWFTGRIGAGAGVHVLAALQDSHALRFRADVTAYPSGPVNIIDGGGNSMLYHETAKARILAAGIDYNYFYQSSNFEGPYLIGGLGYAWLNLTGASLGPGGTATPPAAWPASQNGRGLQYALGWGHNFSPHLGCEFRFTDSRFKDVATGGTQVKAPAINASLTTHF